VIIVSTRNKLVRYLTHLAPGLIRPGAKVTVVGEPWQMADLHFDDQHTLVLDVPGTAPDE
jgi:hypothetical protein